MQPMSKPSTYLRFIALAHAIEDGFRSQDIDLTAQRLLEVVALAAADGQPLTVTEAMSLAKVASPATLHRKLTQLLEAGYVEFRFEAGNRRTKYIHPTKATDKKFDAMGQALKSITT
jgi:DNA-binding MarR family transcriptional regulator